MDVCASEVAADDARLMLAVVEEPVGLGGDWAWTRGSDVYGQAALEVGVAQFVGVEFGRARGQEVQFKSVGLLGLPVTDLAGAAGGGGVHDEVHLAIEVGRRAGPGSVT